MQCYFMACNIFLLYEVSSVEYAKKNDIQKISKNCQVNIFHSKCNVISFPILAMFNEVSSVEYAKYKTIQKTIQNSYRFREV